MLDETVFPRRLAGEGVQAQGATSVPRPTRPATILQVLPALVTGGVERGTVDVATALMRAGCRAIVTSSGGPMQHEIERAGGAHFTLPLDRKMPWSIRSNVRALIKLIERERVDIVHARSRAPAWAAFYAARETRRPFVTTFHGTYNFSNELKRRYNAIMTSADRVIAISDFIHAHILAHYAVDPERVRVVPRGVDLSVFDPQRVGAHRLAELAQAWRIDDGLPVIALPGRLTRWKGQGVLIDAIARLGRRDIHCLLIGADQGRADYSRELTRRIHQLGLGGIVRMVGDCKDMPAAYMLSDVVVSASTDPEAFGRVAVEAGAMGRPVVASDHGGSRETVIPGETGWLVPPGNPDALARAITLVLGLSTEERAVLGRQAQAHIRANFTKELMCASTLAIYQELLATAR